MKHWSKESNDAFNEMLENSNKISEIRLNAATKRENQMKRVSVIYDENDYAHWHAFARAKGFSGKEPLAVLLTFAAQKYMNTAPLTEAEKAVYDKVRGEVVGVNIIAGQSGTV